MRLIGILFLVLAFLAGITVGTLEIALINAVLFLALALAVVKFLEPKYGQQGLVYGMGGAFFMSILWPYAIIAYLSGEDCVGDECLAGSFTTPGAQVETSK